MSKVLILANHESTIYNFRMELLNRLIEEGHEVHISIPEGEHVAEMQQLGCIIHDISIERHGMNPIKEIKLIGIYKKLFDEIKPDIVFSYTIKPNIYGSIAANSRKVRIVANVTGLGTAVENPGTKQKVLIALYKYAFKNTGKVFFQNEDNCKFFEKHGIKVKNQELLPGSGVNLNKFQLKEYPSDEIVRFSYNSRLMREKGIEEYLDAASKIKKKYPNTEFHICGFCEAEYDGAVQRYIEDGTVIYHGMISNMNEYLKDIHCVVHPSFYPEGLSNVLLESLAVGRPIITTDRAGCKEVVEDGINGYMIPQKDAKALYDAIDKFINLSFEEKKKMGLNGRAFVEKRYDRQIVINKYLKEIDYLKEQ